jgi:hypothetical protein
MLLKILVVLVVMVAALQHSLQISLLQAVAEVADGQVVQAELMEELAHFYLAPTL